VKFDFYDVMLAWSLLPIIAVVIGTLRVAFLKLQLTARQGLTLVHFGLNLSAFYEIGGAFRGLVGVRRC